MTPAAGGPYAGFWRRLAAGGLDLLLGVALLAPPMLLIYGHEYFHWSTGHAGLFSVYGVWDAVLGRAVPVAALLVLWTRWGASPGKLLMGCRIVDARSGEPPHPRQAALRLLAYLASALPLYLGFFWIGWDPRKQGFHDKIAGTVVVYRPDEDGAALGQARREAWR